MTLDEMKAIAAEIARVLADHGFGDAEVMDFDPGEPVPISFTASTGDEMVLELSPL